MKKRLKNFLAGLKSIKVWGIATLCLVIAVGTFLPSVITRISDNKTIERTVLVDSDKVKLDYGSNMSLFEKMRAINDYQLLLPKSTEKNSYYSAEGVARKIITNLSKADVIDLGSDETDLVSIEPLLYVDPTNLSNNFYAWKLQFEENRFLNDSYQTIYKVEFIMDDETGEVLSLHYSCYFENCHSFNRCIRCDFQSIVTSLKGYYGFTDYGIVSLNESKKEHREYVVVFFDNDEISDGIAITVERRSFHFN